MNDRNVSKNFKLSEFNYVEPENNLVKILQYLRDATGESIKITNSTRTVKEHIKIYQDLYKDDWLNKIPWGSKHLPAYGRGLRAVDIKCRRGNDYYTGQEIFEIVDPFCFSEGIFYGIGVGKKYVHIDIDRIRNARWGYDY